MELSIFNLSSLPRFRYSEFPQTHMINFRVTLNIKRQRSKKPLTRRTLGLMLLWEIRVMVTAIVSSWSWLNDVFFSSAWVQYFINVKTPRWLHSVCLEVSNIFLILCGLVLVHHYTASIYVFHSLLSVYWIYKTWPHCTRKMGRSAYWNMCKHRWK